MKIYQAYAIVQEDGYGKVIYTFIDKKKADQYWKSMSKICDLAYHHPKTRIPKFKKYASHISQAPRKN